MFVFISFHYLYYVALRNGELVYLDHTGWGPSQCKAQCHFLDKHKIFLLTPFWQTALREDIDFIFFVSSSLRNLLFCSVHGFCSHPCTTICLPLSCADTTVGESYAVCLDDFTIQNITVEGFSLSWIFLVVWFYFFFALF